MIISSFGHTWLYLVHLIPSVLVTIFDLYHLLTNRALRTALNNHVIILLISCGLIETLTDFVLCIYYYFNATALSSTLTFCIAWTFIGSTFLIGNFILMAWTSIERHIIIFHPNLLATKAKRFFFDYLPLTICILCSAIFYFVIFYILPCDNPFNYTKRQCSHYACVYRILGLRCGTVLHIMLCQHLSL